MYALTHSQTRHVDPRSMNGHNDAATDEAAATRGRQHVLLDGSQCGASPMVRTATPRSYVATLHRTCAEQHPTVKTLHRVGDGGDCGTGRDWGHRMVRISHAAPVSGQAVRRCGAAYVGGVLPTLAVIEFVVAPGAAVAAEWPGAEQVTQRK
jgi:hypothetical protein